MSIGEYYGKKVPTEIIEEAKLAELKLDGSVRRTEVHAGDLFNPKETWSHEYVLSARTSSKFFTFRGTNGSGKTTIAKELLKHDKDAYVLSKKFVYVSGNQRTGFEVNTPNAEFCTVLPNFGMVFVGGYHLHKSHGGGDTLNKEIMSKAIEIILNQFKTSHILMEGSILTSSSWHIFGAIDRANRPERDYIHPFVMYMDTPYEVCMERITARNTSNGKETKNTKNVLSKWNEAKISMARYKNNDDINVVEVSHKMTIPESGEWFIKEYL